MFFQRQIYLRYTILGTIDVFSLPKDYAIVPYRAGYEFSYAHIMWDAFVPEFGERIYEFSPNWFLRTQVVNIHANMGQCFFLEHYQLPVGFALLSHDGGNLRFTYMAVLEKYQGQNLSLFLIQKALNYGHENGITSALTNTKHPAAYKQYLKFGFEVYFPTKEDEEYYNTIRG